MRNDDLFNKFLEGTLTPEEERLFASRRRDSGALRTLSTFLGEPASPEAELGGDFDERVVRQHRLSVASRSRSSWRSLSWLRHPAAVPAITLASLIISTFALWLTLRNPSPMVTEFVIAAPDASSVSVVGDFNGWDPEALPLINDNGVWRTRVRLPAGIYQYQFVIDGRRRPDPVSASYASDGFGQRNSVLHVSHTESL